MRKVIVAVSFAATPLREIGTRVERLEALGFRERPDRGDPWVATFEKDFPQEYAFHAEAQVREAMGDYYMDAGAIRELFESG